MLKCPGGQSHPCYTEFAPSPLRHYLPAAQFTPLQGTYSLKVSGALLHKWLSVWEIDSISLSLFFFKNKSTVTDSFSFSWLKFLSQFELQEHVYLI